MNFDDVQQLEYAADIRIKFASIDDVGRWVGDSHDEYAPLFDGMSAVGWSVEELEQPIETVFEYLRSASVLTHQDTTGIKIAAVEHETGVEILVGIAIGTLSTLAASAITGMVKWSWEKWRQERAASPMASHKVEPSLVIERISEVDPRTGKERRRERTIVRGPIDAEEVARLIRGALDDTQN